MAKNALPSRKQLDPASGNLSRAADIAVMSLVSDAKWQSSALSLRAEHSHGGTQELPSCFCQLLNHLTNVLLE